MDVALENIMSIWQEGDGLKLEQAFSLARYQEKFLDGIFVHGSVQEGSSNFQVSTFDSHRTSCLDISSDNEQVYESTCSSKVTKTESAHQVFDEMPSMFRDDVQETFEEYEHDDRTYESFNGGVLKENEKDDEISVNFGSETNMNMDENVIIEGNVAETIKGKITGDELVKGFSNETKYCVGLKPLYFCQNNHVSEFILFKGVGNFNYEKQLKRSKNSESSQVGVPTRIGIGFIHYRKQFEWIDTGWVFNMECKGGELMKFKSVKELVDKNRVWEVGLISATGGHLYQKMLEIWDDFKSSKYHILVIDFEQTATSFDTSRSNHLYEITKKKKQLNWTDTGWGCDWTFKDGETIEFEMVWKNDGTGVWKSVDTGVLKREIILLLIGLSESRAKGNYCSGTDIVVISFLKTYNESKNIIESVLNLCINWLSERTNGPVPNVPSNIHILMFHWNMINEQVNPLLFMSNEYELIVECVDENIFDNDSLVLKGETSLFMEKSQQIKELFMQENEDGNKERKRHLNNSGLECVTFKAVESDEIGMNRWRNIVVIHELIVKSKNHEDCLDTLIHSAIFLKWMQPDDMAHSDAIATKPRIFVSYGGNINTFEAPNMKAKGEPMKVLGNNSWWKAIQANKTDQSMVVLLLHIKECNLISTMITLVRSIKAEVTCIKGDVSVITFQLSQLEEAHEFSQFGFDSFD